VTSLSELDKRRWSAVGRDHGIRDSWVVIRRAVTVAVVATVAADAPDPLLNVCRSVVESLSIDYRQQGWHRVDTVVALFTDLGRLFAHATGAVATWSTL
jgi:hypothetical protein